MGSEVHLQKKYRFFKNLPPFYRNSSVTKSPKTLQLCCASSQNEPNATVCAHFSGHSDAFCFAYFCINMHCFAYHGFVYAFVALRRVPFCVPFPWNDLKLLCSTRHSSSFIKKHKKEAAAQKCATASHNSGYAIEQCSRSADHRAAFAASICLMSSGTTLNRSPTMP